MKNILISLVLFFSMVSHAVAYDFTSNDYKILRGTYEEIDVIYEEDPEELESMKTALEWYMSLLPSDSREYALFYMLVSYIDEITTLPDPTKFLVVDVVDGDTIKYQKWDEIITVRMIGIDTPERWEAWYSEASEYLSEKILWKEVSIEFDESQWMYDRYDRVLAYIFLEEENINWDMVNSWYAEEYTYNKAYKYQKEFQTYEENAIRFERGIWEDYEEEEEYEYYKSNTSGYKTYYTWPRGGCYYWNSNGNKTYVDRSLCN